MEKRLNIALFIILLASLLLTGAESCPQSGTSGTEVTNPFQQYQSTSASRYGLDFSLINGVNLLSSGSKIVPGQTFNVGVHLENYDSAPKSGRICIKDDIDDSYGGIETSCNPIPFNVREATFDDKGNVAKAGSSDIIFPASGYYSYEKFPVTQSAKLFVNSEYIQSSAIQSSVSVPTPISETLSLTQSPAPVIVKVEKSVIPEGEYYRVNLKVTLNNQLSNSEIWTSDFKKKGLSFNIQMGSYPLECTSQNSKIEGNYIEMENNKFITCSTLVPKEQITHPLLMDLQYGVKINKEFSFTIQKEAL